MSGGVMSYYHWPLPLFTLSLESVHAGSQGHFLGITM